MTDNPIESNLVMQLLGLNLGTAEESLEGGSFPPRPSHAPPRPDTDSEDEPGTPAEQRKTATPSTPNPLRRSSEKQPTRRNSSSSSNRSPSPRHGGNPNETIVKEGYIQLRIEESNDDPRFVPSTTAPTKKRWAALIKKMHSEDASPPSHFIHLYHNRKSHSPRQTIDMITVSHVSRRYEKKVKVFGITLHTPEHNYILFCETQQNTDEWQACFDEVLVATNKKDNEEDSKDSDSDDFGHGTCVIRSEVPDCPNFAARSLELWEENLVALDRGEWTEGLEENICAFKRYKTKKRLPLPSQATLRRITSQDSSWPDDLSAPPDVAAKSSNNDAASTTQ